MQDSTKHTTSFSIDSVKSQEVVGSLDQSSATQLSAPLLYCSPSSNREIWRTILRCVMAVAPCSVVQARWSELGGLFVKQISFPSGRCRCRFAEVKLTTPRNKVISYLIRRPNDIYPKHDNFNIENFVTLWQMLSFVIGEEVSFFSQTRLRRVLSVASLIKTFFGTTRSQPYLSVCTMVFYFTDMCA